MDGYYYYHVGANLAAGRGFTEDVVWNYLTPAAAVTHPSNLYWMPLVSIVVAPFLALFGEGFRVAQVPMVLLAALVPAATAAVTLQRTGSRFKAWLAAGLTLFSGYYFVYWGAIDSFGLFALSAGAVFLSAAWLNVAADGRQALLAGVCMGAATGAAHLARADGPLLLVAAVPVLLWASRSRGDRGRALTGLLAAGAGYSLVMGPWLVRNLLVSGAPLPAGGLATMFLTEYNEIFSYQVPLTAQRYLEQGIGAIAEGKVTAALKNLGVLFGLEYWLIPFAVIGGRRLWPWLPWRVAVLYGCLLYLVMTLVFTFPSGRGSMLHSGVALVPWLAIAAVEGLEVAVYWAATRLAHWNAPVAYRNFGLIFLLMSVGLCGYLTADEARDWHKQVDGYAAVVPMLSDRTAPVMALNPPGWWWVSRQPSIQIPSDGPEAALAAAARYGARYLVLEPARSRAWAEFDQAGGGDPHFAFLGERAGFRVYQLGP